MDNLFYVYAILIIPATWFIFHLSRNEKHELRNGEGIFRYPRAFLIGSLLIAIPLIINLIHKPLLPTSSDDQFMVIAGYIFYLLCFVAALVYVSLVRFYFAIGGDGIRWRRFNTIKTLSYNDIKSIQIKDDWRSSTAFGVPMGRRNKTAVRIYGKDGTILILSYFLQDIDALENQLLSHARLHKIEIKGDSKLELDHRTILIAVVITLAASAIFTSFLFHFIDISFAKSEKAWQQTLKQTMQDECAKSCAAYGISLSDLIGPKLEYSSSSKGNPDVIYSWHSNKSDVTLRIENKWYQDTKISTPPQWIINAPNRDPEDISLIENHYHNSFQQVLEDMPSSASKIHGKVVFHFQISPNGHVVNAIITNSSISNHDVEQQLLTIIEGFKFSAGNFQPFDSDYTINVN